MPALPPRCLLTAGRSARRRHLWYRRPGVRTPYRQTRWPFGRRRKIAARRAFVARRCLFDRARVRSATATAGQARRACDRTLMRSRHRNQRRGTVGELVPGYNRAQQVSALNSPPGAIVAVMPNSAVDKFSCRGHHLFLACSLQRISSGSSRDPAARQSNRSRRPAPKYIAIDRPGGRSRRVRLEYVVPARFGLRRKSSEAASSQGETQKPAERPAS